MENNNSMEIASIMDAGIKMNITKSSIQEQGEQILDKLRNGEVDMMQFVCGLKAVSKVIEYVLGEDGLMTDGLTVKQAIIDNVQMNGEGKQENPKLMVSGTEFEVFEAGTKYDFSHDPVYMYLKNQLDARASRLKTCRVPDATKNILPEVDENGVKLYPPAKTSTTTFRINFNK